jgi:hypothetical protein
MPNAVGGAAKRDEDNPMQDLIQNYVSDLNKLRDAFHSELTATAEELSKAMGVYAHRSEAALASFMEKVSARAMELEAAAAARLNQFRGLPANDGLPNVNDGPLADTRTDADRARIAAAAERALADDLHVETDEDRKPQPVRLVIRAGRLRQSGRCRGRRARVRRSSRAGAVEHDRSGAEIVEARDIVESVLWRCRSAR